MRHPFAKCPPTIDVGSFSRWIEKIEAWESSSNTHQDLEGVEHSIRPSESIQVACFFKSCGSIIRPKAITRPRFKSGLKLRPDEAL